VYFFGWVFDCGYVSGGLVFRLVLWILDWDFYNIVLNMFSEGRVFRIYVLLRL